MSIHEKSEENSSLVEMAAVKFEEIFSVQEILAKRVNPETQQPEYLIKWSGFPDSDNSWETLKNLEFVMDDVYRFEGSQPSIKMETDSANYSNQRRQCILKKEIDVDHGFGSESMRIATKQKKQNYKKSTSKKKSGRSKIAKSHRKRQKKILYEEIKCLRTKFEELGRPVAECKLNLSASIDISQRVIKSQSSTCEPYKSQDKGSNSNNTATENMPSLTVAISNEHQVKVQQDNPIIQKLLSQELKVRSINFFQIKQDMVFFDCNIENPQTQKVIGVCSINSEQLRKIQPNMMIQYFQDYLKDQLEQRSQQSR